ncbi:CHAT domain-containing protein [uncultured Winogradskyella sp.]|uniref:CHAT domain-containing protein n=1 Tax=uncultured Winogradskyella sp. TaxID=395353 RepID=UPI0026282E8A|nr:CHAT domain-containing protein [uncultured Winogradskyella sp.]
MKNYFRFFKRVTLFILINCCCTLFAQTNSTQQIENRYTKAYAIADSLYNNKKTDIAEKKLHTIVNSVNDTTQANALYKSFKLLGNINFSKQKLDSSTYYLNKSLDYLKYSSESDLDKNHISGYIKNTIGLNLFNTGKTESSILTLNEAIADLHKYISQSKDEDKKFSTIKKRLACIDNLAGFYRGLGENERAINLATYSYEQKQKILPENDNGLIISRLILGHLHLIARNHNKAGQLVDKGIEHIDKIPFAKSYAYLVRASIYENVDDLKNAKRLYEMCEAVYRENFNGNYSGAFLDAIIEMSNFYTKLDMNDKAIALAKEGYDYTHSDAYQNELFSFFQTQNLSQVYFQLKDYKNALKYSNEALSFFDNRALNTLLDSIQNETRKPRSIYIKSKSEYFLNYNRSKKDIKQLLSQTEKALKVLEKKRNNIKTPFDFETLLIDNNDLINFRKRLFLDLYNKTKDENYLIDLVGLHESSLYNRIRARLNLKKVSFSDVPQEIISKEKALKEAMSTSLNSTDSSIESFNKANEDWSKFLNLLKNDYPKYYKMRYETIEEPLDKLQDNIPNLTTIVRYLFINDDLYAFVVSKGEKHIFKIDTKDITNNINLLAENQYDFSKVNDVYFQLYKQLWKPFEAKINTEKVIIIPDGELFNLSFETLTSHKTNSFKDLAANSLLTSHTISYNYSLLLLDSSKKVIEYEKYFIAFAPEFNDKMKADYSIKIEDSLTMDKAYLKLLPQPFTVNIAKEYSRLFNGNSFINENASKQIFTQNAKEHKIIHIGTHAESNNVSPELSRLIFAKNLNDSTYATDDNSLYSYEIYNQNLSSNLAILTACETGKPTYQSGEGMISLAHAFNYAGSESILTSLWKIDEQSSATIIDYFYGHLKSGLPKDEALQKAKLDYISNAEGRTLSPQYWAGLVLIGDTNPINLSPTNLWWIWSVLVLIVLLALYFFISNRAKSRSRLSKASIVHHNTTSNRDIET